VHSPIQATVGNIVVRQAQSTVIVGQTAVNAVHPSTPVIGGRISVPSTGAANVGRPVVPVNVSVTGMFFARPVIEQIIFNTGFLHQP